MKIKKFDSVSFEKAYGILCADPLPTEVKNQIANGYTWCVIEPNSRSSLHKHYEFELFIVFQGKGTIQSGKEISEIHKQDTVFMDAFQEHELVNTGDEDLILLSIWGDKLKREKSNHIGKRQIIITSTPPTPNGDLHLGHLSGPYLTADIYRRTLLLKGENAVHYTGVDTYQNYALAKAIKENMSPEKISLKFGNEIKETLDIYDIDLALFLEPKKRVHYDRYVQLVFRELLDRGYIVLREVDTTYDMEKEVYLFESFIQGVCPHCEASCSGNLCEACGIPNDCVELKNPRSNLSDGEIHIKKTKRFFFDFDKIAPQMTDFLGSITDKNLVSYIQNFKASGVKYYPVTHISEWGIKVPISGFEDQIISSWFEMGAGHLISLLETGTVEHSQEQLLSELEKAYQNRTFIQMFGFDNSIFNTFLFPSIFLGLGLPAASGLKMNRFLQLEGQKFSTSRNHLIWGKDIAGKLSTDVIRFYLSWISPESKENNFTQVHLEEFQQQVMEKTFKAMITSIQSRLDSWFENESPYTTKWTDVQESFYRDLEIRVESFLTLCSLEKFSPAALAKEIFKLAKNTLDFNSTALLMGSDEEIDFKKTQVSLELLALKVLAIFAYPIMPNFSKKLWQSLRYQSPIEKESLKNILAFVPSHLKIGKLEDCLKTLEQQQTTASALT
jgi:methionyl-tRNA synthetase